MPSKATQVRGFSPRLHIVLIPGFAGFDALGQMEYYAGVTPQFRAWQSSRNRLDTVLHYFDNFPTAAVTTRAQRLRNYLAKRILRGEIAAHDTLALVGHSTGGLDIRRLLWDLNDDLTQPLFFDGTRSQNFTHADILPMVHRVVFLSVPHWGTNIADWVHSHTLGRIAVLAELRAAVETSQLPVLGTLQESLAGAFSSTARIDLLYALQDALAESEVRCGDDRMEAAMAQEANSVLALWLRHMATDFSAISDLSAGDQERTPDSPAHFDARRRGREKQIWHDREIEIQSYATIGKRPYRFDEDRRAPVWDLLNPCTYPECAKDATLSAGTDIAYRVFYRACAGGPFRHTVPEAVSPKPLQPYNPGKIALWDNDGIVNTASMLWPAVGKIFLVAGDHMDIGGHYHRIPAAEDSGRTFDAYDLLVSDSGFDGEAFASVWNSVFDFCATAP